MPARLSSRPVAALLMALLPAALAASALFLAGFVIQSLWTGELKHLPSSYLASMVVFAIQMALAHAIFLGTPLFWGLYRLKWVRWWSSMLAGFVLASIPTAIRYWPPLHATPHTSITVVRAGKMVRTVVNGVPTLAGWLDYARGVLTYAVLGAMAGLVFWLIWRKIQPELERMSARA